MGVLDQSCLKQEQERGRAGRRCLWCCLFPWRNIPFVMAHLLRAHRCKMQTDTCGCCRQIPTAWRWAVVSKAFPHFVSSSIELQLCCAFLQEAESEGPLSDLHGTPKQPESLSSTVKVTRFTPFHRENCKGDGGSVLSSLLHCQLPAVEQKGKAKEWFVLGEDQGHTISSLKHLLKQGSIHGS